MRAIAIGVDGRVGIVYNVALLQISGHENERY